jgi:fructose-1,6-bisphosphatase/inositol monophosphatase family enzyme
LLICDFVNFLLKYSLMENLSLRNEYNPDPELLAQAKATVVMAGVDSYHAYRSLTPQMGLAEVDVNQFREVARLADKTSEVAMIHQVEASGIPTRWESEEHRDLKSLNCNPEQIEQARQTAIGDGIDGTDNAVKDWENGRYGAMFSIGETGDPRYGDYLAASITMFTEDTVLYAAKGQGAWTVNMVTGEQKPAHVSEEATEWFSEGKQNLQPDDKLYDFYSHVNWTSEALGVDPVDTASSGSTAANAFDVATGRALFDISATRKGNLEQFTIKAIIEEAGGVLYAVEPDEDGRLQLVSLDDKRFFGYGQDRPITLITAASQAIAERVVERLQGSLA